MMTSVAAERGGHRGVGRLLLLQLLQVVEPSQEAQVGDLLGDLKRIGDAARPKRGPDRVDPGFDFASSHKPSPPCSRVVVRLCSTQADRPHKGQI